MRKSVIYIAILTFILSGISLQTGIFWDNITFISRAGNWLYENGLCAWFSLPDSIDSGHPLLPAMWCVMIWKIFGKSLLITHLSLVIFIFITLYFLWRVVEFLFSDLRLRIIAFVIAAADATLLSQLILIGPEVFLLAFFMMALYSILYKKELLLSISLALLGIVSLRGMMLCLGLFFTDLILHKDQWNIKHFIPYLIGALPACIFLALRLIFKGWIISNPLHPWGSAFEFDSVGDFFSNFGWNILVLGFRYVDLGRIFIWILLLIMIGKNYKQLSQPRNRQLIILAFVPTSIVLILSLIICNPIGHRYFTISFIFVSLLAISLLENKKIYKFGWMTILICLLAGNFIVYPENISQNWDASLAHLPYWKVRTKTLAQMEEQGIDITKTATFFPALESLDNIDFNGDKRAFLSFDEENLPTYVLYSSVNNLENQTLQILHTQYEPIISNKFVFVHCDVLQLKSTNQP